MRHGKAELRPGPDANRRLTISGEQEVVASAGKIVKRVRPESIVASPYTRAQQTAHLVRNVWNREILIDTWDEVTPNGKCALVRDKLLGMASRQMLHAEVLGFVHPVTGEKLQFQAEPPEDMQAVLERLAGQ